MGITLTVIVWLFVVSGSDVTHIAFTDMGLCEAARDKLTSLPLDADVHVFCTPATFLPVAN